MSHERASHSDARRGARSGIAFPPAEWTAVANNVGRADLADRRLEATFPRASIDNLGPNWKWQAALTIEGYDKSERPWVLGDSSDR
jgi:hypothetical protein